MNSEKIKKIAVIVLIHLLEVVIMYFIGMWIWTTMADQYKMWTLAAMLVIYAGYFIVCTINDYRNVKYYIPEPPM